MCNIRVEKNIAPKFENFGQNSLELNEKKKFLDSSSSFGHEQIVVVKFGEKITVCAEEEGL